MAGKSGEFVFKGINLKDFEVYINLTWYKITSKTIQNCSKIVNGIKRNEKQEKEENISETDEEIKKYEY